ncbi:hypothetical protein VTN00DRAFT_8466 [Thermoascus crustaceus]|uniref:uncharacterized protein n=1 Tax=Thermoascus crustaceus TaxID=5088 RepID=UPI0037443258
MFVRLLAVARLLALVAVMIGCVDAEYFKYSGERSTLSRGETYGRSVKEGSASTASQSELLRSQSAEHIELDWHRISDRTRRPFTTKASSETSGKRLPLYGDRQQKQEHANVEHPRVWAASGPGWDVLIQLTSWPTTPTVSSVDWVVRWEKAIKCLAIEEPDNQDMFEIDELAVKAFWDRVWACYLPYVLGSKDA